MRRIAGALLSLGLVACAHDAPFTPGPYGPGGPYSGSAPLRVTFDFSGDSTPIWLPGESALLYSFQRADRVDHDRCLGILPVQGGARTRQICHASALSIDSIDTFTSPALSPGGRLAYFRATDRLFRNARTFVGIGVGTLAAPESGPLLDNLPRGFSAGLGETATQLGWLSDTDFVYLAVSLAQPPVIPSRPVAVVRARLRADSAVYEILANTDTATSVAVAGPDAIYYTVEDDSRVFRRVLSTDATSVAHDFGGGRFPTAVQVAGSRLAAIVSNQIWLVDLTDSSETFVPAPGAAQGLALAPSGTRLVATLSSGGNVDLWVFDLP
jgi:hypothetical protein